MLASLALIGLYLLFLGLAGLVQALVLLAADQQEAGGQGPTRDIPDKEGPEMAGLRSGGAPVLVLSPAPGFDQKPVMLIWLPCLLAPAQPAEQPGRPGALSPGFKH